MRSLIRKCPECGQYTLKEQCASCGSGTEMAIPPRYSQVDRFQKYRIKLRELSEDGKNNNKPV